jgi:hypothetical protein
MVQNNLKRENSMENMILIVAVLVLIISLYPKKSKGVNTTTIKYAISID